MRKHGPSIYFVSDKNIYDALNQHKVNIGTIENLFKDRNIIISKHTKKDELASYFSQLPHDYYDHKTIASKLGVAARRERITSVDLKGQLTNEQVKSTVNDVKKLLEENGDIVQVSRDNDDFKVSIQYTVVDFRKSEFNQLQVKDADIEFIKTEDGYALRNHHNDYIDGIRDSLIESIKESVEVEKVTVSLFDVPSSSLRTQFFYDLTNGLEGYTRLDVTEVFVYKAKPESIDEDNESEDDYEVDTHVEKVLLRGNGVTRSDLLNDLLDEENYYVVKIGWIVKEQSGLGNHYELQASFSDPSTCDGFSYILTGVYDNDDGKVSSKKRSPNKDEINIVTRAIEVASKKIMLDIRKAYQDQNNDGESE